MHLFKFFGSIEENSDFKMDKTRTTRGRVILKIGETRFVYERNRDEGQQEEFDDENAVETTIETSFEGMSKKSLVFCKKYFLKFEKTYASTLTKILTKQKKIIIFVNLYRRFYNDHGRIPK